MITVHVKYTVTKKHRFNAFRGVLKAKLRKKWLLYQDPRWIMFDENTLVFRLVGQWTVRLDPQCDAILCSAKSSSIRVMAFDELFFLYFSSFHASSLLTIGHKPWNYYLIFFQPNNFSKDNF